VKFELTDYQAAATSDVIGSLQEGFGRFAKNGKLTAVSLSAPTGAGKTVIATAVIEQMLYGDENTEPNPDLTVLWVTDDPSLNQQTKRKMLMASSLIKPRQLVTVDPSLDSKELDRGRVYFVHIQQLGKGATNYVKTGNKRKYSLWDIIGNTIAARGSDFVLIIDEAHKGTAKKAGGNSTITSQLMDGAGGNFPPTPVVLGISATPERFNDAISKAGQRTQDPVAVDPDAVRQSGLLKDKIRIKHPTETQPGDSTLLELAVSDLQSYDTQWDEYSTEQKEPVVQPVLVIQVKAKVSDADLKATLDTLASAWNVLDGKAVGHAFQEHTTLNLGPRSVRYVAPQDIQDDPHLRVVLFKEALTTGWDCPRAEVMLSFRTAKDYTYIAQLIGRMVRTPLARRVATNDVLNTVALYLPHYDEGQVTQVITGLQTDDSQITSEVEVESVTCTKSKKVPDSVWDILNELPTYTRPGKHHRNEVARLNALATLLVGTKLDANATDTAKNLITGTLDVEAERLKAELDEKVKDFMELDYQTQVVDLASGSVVKETASVSVNARNIDDLFRRAKRLLGDAAAKWYWDKLVDVDDLDPDDAKVKVAALADDPSVAPALEAAAKTLVDTWRTRHNSAISKLPDAKRERFYSIWQQAKAPQQVTMIMPNQVTAADKRIDRTGDGEPKVVAIPRHAKHVYANGKGTYPAPANGWEADVLAAELARDSTAAWYRNPTGGPAALAVPYKQSTQDRTLYPDFLFFHQDGDEVVVDIVDPHRPDASDTGPKWTGLAQYAADHGDKFRQVLAVIKDANDQLVSLDLKNPDVATQLEKAANETDIRKVFADFGGAY
jgi:type III restriction enzyme